MSEVKRRQDKEELCQLLATYPLELIHIVLLTVENPCTGPDMNIWS